MMDFPPKAFHKHLGAEQLFFSSYTSQPVASHSQYYKVPFVSFWQHGTLGYIHMGPHGDTRYQSSALILLEGAG